MTKFSIVLFLALSLFSCQKQRNTPSITIKNKVVNEINPMLFGQFVEKCSWDNEIGGDLLINKNTGEIDSLVMAQLKSLKIPVMRYPGGFDVDYFNWTDLIDNAPGQTERKPYYSFGHGSGDSLVSDNRLGMHEFFSLCEELGSEAIMVLNIGDAFFGKITIEEAKANAADVLAYCNLDKVNSGTDWPAYRKMNGREEPFNIKYFQIGNESWGFKGFDWEVEDRDQDKIEHLFDCIIAVSDTLKALDPSITLLADGAFSQLNVLHEKYSKGKIDMIVFHNYKPWNIDKIVDINDSIVIADSISAEASWNAWVSTPAVDSTTGFSCLPTDHATINAMASSFDIAVTEWNWNGWFSGAYAKAKLPQPDLAKGIGAAGFVHGFMRNGDKIKMACQSMLAGKAWGITGIRIDPEYKQESVTLPTAMVTGLYANYHGNELLQTEYMNIPIYKQPYQMNSIAIQEKVAYLDILTSKSANQLFIHVINRNYTQNYNVDVNIEDIKVADNYMRYTLQGDKSARVRNKKMVQDAEITEEAFSNADDVFTISIPSSSVSVFVLDIE